MATQISYGGYNFPHPYPYFAIEHEPIIINGSLDHSVINASLIGELTGCDFTSLKRQKDNLISALSTGFQTLTVGEKTYQYAQPTNVEFSSSNIKNRLPYSINYIIQNETDFSSFYGIKEPVDTWSFSESEDRTVSASHTVSAYGVKIDGDSLTNARNFVNSRLNGFQNYSVLISGRNPILVSKNETIDRASNFYSIVEDWRYSISQNNYDKNNVIVRANSSINYNQDGSLNVTVQGTIEGGLSNSVNTGYFTKLDATNFAKDALSNSKAPFEISLYGSIIQEPKTYSYEYDSGSNMINFNYSFGDPSDTRTGEVLHNYSTSVQASKDSALINVSVRGSIFYNKVDNPNTGLMPESGYRFKKVNDFFSGINPFAIALDSHKLFVDTITGYTSGSLNSVVNSYEINKNPFDSKIEYTYNYSNNIDYFSGFLLNPSISVETQQAYLKYNISQTVDNSFAVQNVYSGNKVVSVSVNGDVPENKNINSALNIVNNYIQQYSTTGKFSIPPLSTGSFLIEENVDSGDGKLSVRKTFFFK